MEISEHQLGKLCLQCFRGGWAGACAPLEMAFHLCVLQLHDFKAVCHDIMHKLCREQLRNMFFWQFGT